MPGLGVVVVVEAGSQGRAGGLSGLHRALLALPHHPTLPAGGNGEVTLLADRPALPRATAVAGVAVAAGLLFLPPSTSNGQAFFFAAEGLKSGHQSGEGVGAEGWETPNKPRFLKRPQLSSVA